MRARAQVYFCFFFFVGAGCDAAVPAPPGAAPPGGPPRERPALRSADLHPAARAAERERNPARANRRYVVVPKD